MVGIRTVCPTVQFLASQTVCLAVQFSYYWLILAIVRLYAYIQYSALASTARVGWCMYLFSVRVDVTDVHRNRGDSFLHSNRAIVVYFDYFIRSLVGVITELGRRVRAVENLLSYFIFVRNSP